MLLFAAYSATAAPGVTYWDSGEFIAAARSWGIPHPPGTPLYVTIARAFTAPVRRMARGARRDAIVGGRDRARRVGLAWAIARSIEKESAMGLAAALCAGAMSTAWSSATETEAYATALLLAMGMLVAAERARAAKGMRDGRRQTAI